MKKILEYKVFDLLKDKDNENFLDKVKKENPDLYAHFLSILGNKGLEVAKQKYQEYDPEYVELQKKKEKEEKLKRKKQNTKEFREEHKKFILNDLKTEISEIEDILLHTQLKDLEKFINNDDRISEYLDSCRSKKIYTNNFKPLLKNPNRLSYELRYDIKIDSLIFATKYYSYDIYEEEQQEVIKISQFYNQKTKVLTYSIYYNLFSNDEDFLPKIDGDKKNEFLVQRKNKAQEFEKIGDKLSEIYESLKKFSVLLDERIYQKWYEEWELRSSANKYNL